MRDLLERRTGYRTSRGLTRADRTGFHIQMRGAVADLNVKTGTVTPEAVEHILQFFRPVKAVE